MKKIDETVFTVSAITDYPNQPVAARFKTQKEAEKLKPLMGGYGGEIKAERLEFLIFDTFEEYMEYNGNQLKKSALEKLTKEERFALGL
jgi:hypothetical protein